MLDRLVPMTVDAKVRDGFVTLTGTAQWQYQRDEAEFLTASVPGVFGIENDISLTSTPDGRDIQHDISDAFRRSAKLDANHTGPGIRDEDSMPERRSRLRLG